MTKHFKISWDLTLKIATTAITIFFVVITIYAFIGDDGKGAMFIAPFFALITFIVYLYAPKSYDITNTEIFVNRPGGKKTIQRSAIKSITIPNKKEMKWTWRTLGIGGMFGYYGSFTNSRFGDMTWFVTNRKNLVMVQAGYDRFVFSPDDVNGFINALNVTD